MGLPPVHKDLLVFCPKDGVKKNEDKVCNMCGDIGVSEELVTCNRCKKTSEHIYCMNVRRKKIPVLWYCEECLKCRSVIHKEIEGKSKKQMTVYCNTSNVKSSEGLGKRSLGVDMNQARNSIVHNGTENKSKKQKVVYGDSNEFNLKSSESHAKRSLGDDMNQTKAADGNTRDCSSKYVMTKQHVSNDKDSKKQELKDSGIAFRSQTLQLPLSLTRNQDEKLSRSHCAPEACWKGTFKIFEVLHHDYKGIRAHLPCVLCPKVEKISKKLPKTVTFKKVLPRREVWPKIFRLDPPTKEDIGLYFFPSEQERFKERYTRLLKRLDDRDFALEACIKDTQLLIFSSNQLPQDSRRISGEPYLWGVFRQMKRKEPSKHTGLKSRSTPTTKKMAVPIDPDVPPGFSKMLQPVSSKRWHSSWETPPSVIMEFPSEKVANSIDFDVRPGLSKLPHPGFSELLWSKQRHSSSNTTFHSAIQSSIDGINCLPSITTEENISQASHDHDVKPMSFQEYPSDNLCCRKASDDLCKSSEHPKSNILTLSFEENRWLYLLGSSKSCAKFYAPSENLPSSSTLESLCGSSDNHSSLMHRTVKVEMFGDEKIQRKDTCIPRTVPDVPPGFSKLLTAGFSTVKTKCPQASENWCKSAEPPEGSTLICSTENRESCTELHPTRDNLPPSPTTENVCGSSNTLSGMHKTIMLEMLGDEKIDRRGTSITRVDIVPDSLETSSEKNRRDASITRADTVPDSLEANLEKNKPPIRFSLKKVTSPIRANAPHCFLVGKTKELEDSSKGPCHLKVNRNGIVSSPTVESHAAKAPKDCQATDCGQSSAEHPTSNSPLYHVKERKGFSSFASPDAHSKHQSIIENRSSSASPLPLKKKAHCELSPSLNLESLSAVKKILLECKEKRKIKERDRQGLKSENLTRDKENLLSGDKSVASTHGLPISLSQGNTQMSLVSAFYGSPSIFYKSSANGSKS